MSKQLTYAFVIFGLTLGGAHAQAPQPSPPGGIGKVPSVSTRTEPNDESDLIEGQVVTIEDGDTISVMTRERILHKVRLQAIDAPDDRQPYFEKSKKNLSNLLLRKTVRAVYHSKDSSGRLIATVYQNGRDVGLIQVESGLAWHYKRFSYEQTATARKSYSDAQALAVTERKGLWDDKSPIPPWVFRGDTFATQSAVPINVVNRPVVQNGERKYLMGPRGGCYYLSESGAKVYVKDKTLCGAATPVEKP